jgi:phytol kinase
MFFILAGNHGPVVSLLDPANPEDAGWIERERALLESNGIPFISRPVVLRPFDPQRVLAVAREVRMMPKPVVVHAFLPAASGRSPAAEAFLMALRADRAPLPPSGFDEPMATGERVRVLAPHVAAGPRPQPGEFGSFLARRGVRRVVYLGDPTSAEAREDRRHASIASVEFHALDPGDGDLDRLLEEEGPWYVYGPGLGAAEGRMAAAQGPAVPAEMREPRVDLSALAGGGGAPWLEAAWERIRSLLPGTRGVILAAPVFLLAGALCGSAAGWLRCSRGVRVPYTRKIFHFLIFTMAGVVHLAGGLPQVMLFGGIIAAAVLYAVWRGEGFPFYESMARPTDEPRRSLFILIPLATTAVGGLLSNLLFGAFAHVGYLVAGWGDAVGEPVGGRWGKHRYRVPSLGGVAATRSFEGSAAVLLVGTLGASVALVLQGRPAGTAILAGLICGAVGAAVEAFSHHGLDNLTIQVAASGAAWLLLAQQV